MRRLQYVPTNRTAEGVILGATASKPLQVSVTVTGAGRSVSTTVFPTTAMLTDVLAKTAGTYGTTFTYASIDDNIFLVEFFGQRAGGGYWQILVNGTSVSSLSDVPVRQGDVVTAEWHVVQP